MGGLAPEVSDKVVETPTARQWLGSDGMVRHVLRDGAVLDLPAARLNLRAVVTVSEGQRLPMVAVVTGLASATRQVRQFYAGAEAAEAVSCVAMVTGSAVSRVIGNFFVALNRPQAPTRMFGTLEQALVWAASHK